MFTALDILRLPVSVLAPPNRCTKCKGTLRDEEYPVDDGVYCGDCYYAELSDVLERFPVGHGKGRG